MPPRKYSRKSTKKKYSPKKRIYKRKRIYRRNTSKMIISKPLLPPTQKVMLKYYTRFHINPLAVASTAVSTAHDLPLHTFAWNDPYDPDKTHSLALGAIGSATGRHQDGAPDHQPRMYDQYGSFYDKITVIGAKAKITFSNSNRIVATLVDNVKNNTGTIIETIESKRLAEPHPTFVGYLNSTYNDEAIVSAKWDSVREKNEVRYRRLIDSDRPQSLVAKWSLNKEKVFKSKLALDTDAEAPENFTASFNHSPVNLRFLHLFACPITVTNGSDPAPVDVEVELSQICLLSDRKEVPQS